MAELEFTAGMLMRASARRSREDQVDRHVISLASGETYAGLGAMTRREYNEQYLSHLRMEVIPEPMRVVWEDDIERWCVRLCDCDCECDDCLLVVQCGVCQCGGEEVIQFREVLENDMERVYHTSPGHKMDYPRLVEIVTGAKDLHDWRLKRYKTIETAVVWSMSAPLSGTQR